MSQPPSRPTTPARAPADHPSGDARFALIDRAVARVHRRPDALIEVLSTAQETFGYLAEDVLVYVARQLQVPLSRAYGVATFYHLFSLRPRGNHACTVCLGTACYVKQATEILAAVESRFHLLPGEVSADGRLGLSTARCLGSCGLAPVLVLDGEVFGQATPASALAALEAALRPSEPA